MKPIVGRASRIRSRASLGIGGRSSPADGARSAMSDASPVLTVTTPVRPRPMPRPVRRMPSTSSAVSSSSSRSAQRITPAASRAASVARASPASDPEWAIGCGACVLAPADLDGHDRLAELQGAIRQRQEPLGATEPLEEQDDRGRLRVVEAVREVVADVEDDLRSAADDPAEADPRPRLDERVGHGSGLRDAGDPAAGQVRRNIADVARRVDGQVDDAHAVRPDERHPVSAGDLGDLGLHGGSGRTTLDDTATGDDHRRDARIGRGLGDGGRAERVERDEGDVRSLRQLVEGRVARLAQQLVVLGVHEVTARRAAHEPQVVADGLGDPAPRSTRRRSRSSRAGTRVAGRSDRIARSARWRSSPAPSSDHPIHPAPLQGTRDDQPLDLRRPLPDPVDPKLPEEPLGGRLAHVAAAAEDLDDPVGAAEGRLRREQLRERRLGVDDLRVGAAVGQDRRLAGQQSGRRRRPRRSRPAGTTRPGSRRCARRTGRAPWPTPRPRSGDAPSLRCSGPRCGCVPRRTTRWSARPLGRSRRGPPTPARARPRARTAGAGRRTCACTPGRADMVRPGVS